MDIKEPREDRRNDPIPGEYGFPIPKELFFRELGFGGFSAFHNFPRFNSGKKVISQSLATKAVHTLCTKELTRRKFKLPNGARTTFHIAFSADGTKIASCHGDHNVYICDVASGEVIQTLAGHPRTPWCVVFHPTQNDVLASGCLAGHVRVWDLKGGSELLVTDSGTVIASLAFHPFVRLLAIATFNEIIFWDWGHPYPMARCSTENTKEKVRLVRFDRLGRSLITGITNFPSPPCREEVRRPVRGGNSGALFRPNILSRNFRGRRFSPAFPGTGTSRDDNDSVEDLTLDNDNEVVEEVVQDPEVSAEAEAFAVAAVAGDEDSLIVGETLSARQDRFQESYRQLVSHYEELVSNYQQFLRSRIPRFLEGSSPLPPLNLPLQPEPVTPEVLNTEVVSQLEDAYEIEPLPNTSHSQPDVSETDNDSSEHITTLESPSSPIVMDDEVPGPSRLLFESNQPELLTQTSATEEEASTVQPSNAEPTPSSSSTPGSSSDPPGNRSGIRSETDLRSIEALAQNILEMQNLCSQVRMDAPLAVENQHIVELRVIRRHLELLQEQTRDLQSSIRATLNSLATGSLAALRSHVASATSTASTTPSTPPERQEQPILRFAGLEQVTPPTPIGPGPVMDFEPHSPPLSPSHRDSSTAPTPEFPSPRDTPSRELYVDLSGASPSPRSSGAPTPTGSSPNTLYRIMIATPFSESNRLPNTPLFNRIRVPPVVAMQYEQEGSPRHQDGAGPSRNFDESHAGSFRESGGHNGRRRDQPPSSSTSTAGTTRRIVREFHVVGGRPGTFVAEEHARHCPFSGRDPYHWRPPPRMRSLHDMGEMPRLVPWPTMETGMETSIRNYRDVTPPLMPNNRVVRSYRPNITITVRNGLGIPLNVNSPNESSPDNIPIRNDPFICFSEWLLSSGIAMANLTNDIAVGIYIATRQLNEDTSENSSVNERWAMTFRNSVSSLAIIRPSVRQGQRPSTSVQAPRYRRRRAQWLCYANPTSSSSPTSSPSHGSRTGSVSSTTSTSSNSSSSSSSNGSSSSGSNSSSSSSNNVSPQDEAPPFSCNTSSISNISLLPLQGSSSQSGGSSKWSESGSGNKSNSGGSGNNASTGLAIPNNLEINFTRVFYIRAADELIPVYSPVNSAETVLGTEVRESLQVNVYYLPIGLFLAGGPWETSTQTIGIHWPPVTREEEYAILDLRMSDRPLSVHQTDTRESLSNNHRLYPRIRLDYDQTSLRVTLPTGFSLHFIQSGLLLLDCVSNSISLPRPRPLEGTVWIDYLGPFLDAMERMFGLRHTRRTLGSIPAGNRVGAYLGRTPPWMYAGGVAYRPSSPFPGPPPQSPNLSNSSSGGNINASAASGDSGSNNGVASGASGTGTSVNSSASAGGSSYNRSSFFSSRRGGGDSGERDRPRRIITHAHDAPVDARRRFYEDNPMVLSHGYMYENNGGGFRFIDRGGGGDNRRFYFRQRQRHELPNPAHGETRREGADGNGSRFIRLAVDTAASEVLRRNQMHHHHHHADMGIHESQNGLPVVEAGSASGFSTIGRPVESRIERVLNERGNRGAHSPSPPGMLEESSRNRMRLEEIQMRISMLSQWSRARAMATSGTQTSISFLRAPLPNSTDRPSTSSSSSSAATSAMTQGASAPERGRSRGSERRQQLNVPGPSTSTATVSARSGGGELRITRRRPYSRIARIVPNHVDADSDDDIIVSVPARIPRLNNEPSPETLARRHIEEPGISSQERGRRIRQHIDQWVVRIPPTPPAQPTRNRPQSVLEISGSARTRASPLNRTSPEDAESNDPDLVIEREIVRNRFPRTSARGGGASGSNGVGSNDGNNNNVGNNGDEQNLDAGARFYPGYIPEILITPRTRAPTYYTMDAATTAFLSSRIQKWSFTGFTIPDITKRDDFVVVRECSLHSDACLDVSSDSEFLAVLQPSDSGSYSSVGIYSLRDDSLGDILNIFHFDQNTVSVSISPSCDYLVVGYAGRGPLYRFVHPSRNIGKILSLTRDEDGFKLVPVKDLYTDGQVAFMSINCMHWVPVAGYGIIYGTNTGDLVLLN